MFRRLLPIFAFALVLAACERPFELKEGTLSNKLYLDCVAGAGDSTFVTVQTCIPVNSGKAVKTVQTVIESMTLKIGDTPAALVKDTRPGQKYNRWYTLAPVADGQEVSVEVKAQGMEAASGRSVVPPAPVIKSLSMVPCRKDTSWFDVLLELDGEYPEGAYYGISCQMREEYAQYDVDIDTIKLDSVMPVVVSDVMTDSLYVEESQLFDLTFDGTTLIDDFSLMGMFMTYWAEGMMQVYIPRPKYFSRHGHKFHLYVPRHYSDSLSYHQPEVIGLVPDSDDLQVIPEHDVVIPEHDVVMHTRYSYRWQVLRLSDDFFHFTQSRYLQRTNPLSFIGLAPAMSAWSNVSGGFGVVAGCRVTEIPWQESRRPAGLLNTR